MTGKAEQFRASDEKFPTGRDKEEECSEFRAQLEAWKAAAEADGWVCTHTYKEDDPHYTLKRESGWQARISLREYHLAIHVWRPDGMSVGWIPQVYDRDSLMKGAKSCHQCGKIAPLSRYSFAGLAYAECLPDMQKQFEYPGWTN
jgi:hypothetical protein